MFRRGEKQLHHFLSCRSIIRPSVAIPKLYAKVFYPVIRLCVYFTDITFGSHILVHGKQWIDPIRKLRMDDNQLLDDHYDCSLLYVV